jgi:hypothetical protein
MLGIAWASSNTVLGCSGNVELKCAELPIWYNWNAGLRGWGVLRV